MAEEESTAEIGFGTDIDISTDAGATWDSAGQVSGDITPPASTTDTWEGTHMRSPNHTKEFGLGLDDPGNCSYPIHFNASSSVDQLYRSIRAARERVKVRITFVNGAIWTFTGLLTGYAPAVPLADRQTAEVTWKVSGSTVVT